MGGDVYFSVRSFPEYGKLSGRDIDEMHTQARIEADDRKRDPLDFALWKAAKPGEPHWAARGARDGPGGTSSARRCRRWSWDCHSTSTAAAAI